MGEPHAPVFVDALPLLEAALGQLGDGELVKVEDMQLVQIMSAIEIMDARTDSYLAHQHAQAATGPKLVHFDPTFDLLPDELVWILDEILRLEITHLDGHPLVSTLLTCNYLRPRALADLSFSPGAANRPSDPLRLPGFRTVVLRAMLLATLKCAEIVWEECCKGLVYEHEDVHLSTAGLSFPGLLSAAFPPPAVSPLRVVQEPAGEERIISVDEVLEALDGAQNWLVENMQDNATREGLLGRIAIRMETVYVVALLTTPHLTSPEQLLVHFSRIRPAIVTLNAPSSLVPSPHLKAIFAQGPEPPLQTPQPFREISPISLVEAWHRWSDILAELENVAQVWESWRGGLGWAGVREYFVSLGRRETLPYPRSILQTITFSSRTLFATDDPVLLVSSFFHTLAGVPPSTWVELSRIRATEQTWNSPARKCLGWADRVGALLVASLTTACQNRARARRLVVKHRATAGQLVDELDDILPILTALLPRTPSLALLATAITSLHITQLLEVLLCGFELELYARDEWIRVWWVGERLAGLLEDTWAQLRAPERVYVEARWNEVRVVRAMCAASISAFCIKPPLPATMLSPLLSYDEPDVTDRARFERRFTWLQGSYGGRKQLETLAPWPEFVAASQELALLPCEQHAQMAQSAYREAVSGLTTLASIPLAARGATVRPEHNVRWIAGLRRTSFASQNALAAFPKLEGTVAQAAPPARWDSPWFPVCAWTQL